MTATAAAVFGAPRRREQRIVLPTRYRNILHSYQALPAWDKTATKLLYLGFDDTAEADIVIRDVASGEERAIARTESFNFHCAAWQHWACDDTAIIYRGQEAVAGTPPMLVSVDAPADARPITDLTDCLVRQVINHGAGAVFYSKPAGDRLAQAGIYNLDAGNPSLVFDAAEAVGAIQNGALPDPRRIGFQHVLANLSGTKLFFKLDELDENGVTIRERSLHAFDVASRQFTDFGGDILGHPSWIDDRFIANVEKTRDGSDDRWLVAMDSVTSEVRRLHDLPIAGAGHPCVSPDGRWLVTDSFTADQKRSRLYLFDLAAGTVREIDALDHSTVLQKVYNPHVITRAHPHPTWSPDSRSILANYNFGGDHLGLVMWTLN